MTSNFADSVLQAGCGFGRRWRRTDEIALVRVVSV
jgi:hypothetical protein